MKLTYELANQVRWAFGDSYPRSTLQQAVANKTLFMDWWNTRVLVKDPATCSDSLLLYTAGAQTVYRNEYLPYVWPLSYSDLIAILGVGNDLMGEVIILIFAGYRPPKVPFGFSTSRISVFSEVPDVVIPSKHSPSPSPPSFPLPPPNPAHSHPNPLLPDVLTTTTVGQSPYNSTITQHTEYLPVTVDILAAKGCDGMIFNLVLELQKAGIVRASAAGQTVEGGGEVLLRRGM